MSTGNSDIPVPLWALRQPPSGLTDQWERIYVRLVDPILLALTFQPEWARQGVRDLLGKWKEHFYRSDSEVATVLGFLHGRSSRTWRAGQRIRVAFSHVKAALSVLVQYLDNPHPGGQEAKLREAVVEKQRELPADSLVDELASAVVADCAAERGVPVGTPVRIAAIDRKADLGRVKPTLSETQKNILRLCRKKYYKGATIASKLGLSYGYCRKPLASLVKLGLLKNDPERGYRCV